MKKMLFLAWADYYDKLIINEDITNEKFTSQNKTLSPKTGNTYVYNCFFQSMSADYGAAILSTQSKNNLLVEKSTFLQCKASLESSTIRVTRGNVTLAFICGQYGEAGKNDAFSSIWLDTQRKINTVCYSSISYCKVNGSYTIVHDKGCVQIKSLNLSHNKAIFHSSLRAESSIKDENNFGTIIS